MFLSIHYASLSLNPTERRVLVKIIKRIPSRAVLIVTSTIIHIILAKPCLYTASCNIRPWYLALEYHLLLSLRVDIWKRRPHFHFFIIRVLIYRSLLSYIQCVTLASELAEKWNLRLTIIAI